MPLVPTAIACPTVFDGQSMFTDHCVIVRGDKIESVIPIAQCPPDIDLQNLKTGTLAPGFIDLQVNGGGDVLFHNTPTVEAIQTMAAAHRSMGTTSLLPTLLSGARELRAAALQAVKDATTTMPEILGIHIEGPYFSAAKAGAHEQSQLEKPQQNDIDKLCEPQDFSVLLTLAPEEVSFDYLKQLASAGVLVAAGHTSATYQQLQEASEHGIQGVTHLFNAMSPLATREPGAVGAALDNDTLWAGIIADGHHVHAAGIRLAHAAKPAGKLILVSDAMATIGGKEESFELYGETVYLRNERLINAAGNLAGSAIALIDAVRYCHTVVGLALEDCLRMASLYPAKILQLDDRLGRLAPGYRADMVHFDEGFNVHGTWTSGLKRPRTSPADAH